MGGAYPHPLHKHQAQLKRKGRIQMADQNQSRKRPGWVWAISVFFFLSAGWTLVSFFLINTGAVTPNALQEAYFSSLTGVDYGLTILIALANLLAAVALFLLRKIAFYLFLTAFGANLLLTAWHTVTKGWVAAMGAAGLIGALIGWILVIAVCIYSWRLIQRGVLT
jgi:hypothetical protein